MCDAAPVRLACRSFTSTASTRQQAHRRGCMYVAHGLLGSSQNWSTVSQRLLQHRALREHIQVVHALDMRNHGSSPHASEHTNVALASDLEAFVLRDQARQPHAPHDMQAAEQNDGKDVNGDNVRDDGYGVLVGHSMGGLAVMGMLLRRYNERVLLSLRPTSPPSSCATTTTTTTTTATQSHHFGAWPHENALACAAAMRAVNVSCGYSATQPLRDVLFASARDHDVTGRDTQRDGARLLAAPRSRIAAAVVVDITPQSLDATNGSAAHAPLMALRAMQSIDVRRLRNYTEADAALCNAGVADRALRGFIATNLVFGSSDGTVATRWRCNVPALLHGYAQLTPSIVRWFAAHNESGSKDAATLLTSSPRALYMPQPCTLPVLFVFGEHSPYNGARERATLARLFPHATQVVVAGAGHYVHYEKTDDFVNYVAAFLCQHVWQHGATN